MASFMNVEEIRDYCLSLGSDVEEKLPFTKFRNGEGVLAGRATSIILNSAWRDWFPAGLQKTL